MQAAQAAADHVSGQVASWQHRESSLSNDREKDYAAQPYDQRQQHEKAQESHATTLCPNQSKPETENRELTTENCLYTGTGTLSTISRRTCSACSDFFSVDEYSALTTTR